MDGVKAHNTKGPSEPLAEAKLYINERGIHQLFQSLTVSLLHHQPADPVQFLIDALDHEPEGGWNNVIWDSFLQHTCRKSNAETDRANEDSVEVFRLQQSKDTHLYKNNSDVAQQLPDSQIWDILRGSLSSLPAMPTSTVRIFLSSTFSDFKAERNILPKKAYPEIQKFCQELGLDFQVMDMRWGVTDDMMNDHQVSALCLREIATCKQVSCGPNFVTLLGNRYGYRPFPSIIPATEFDILFSLAKENHPQNYHLLSEWFLLDENACPPSYVLQPIHSKFINYNNAENKELRQRDIRSWNSIHDTIQIILQECVRKAVECGKLATESRIKYTISVTETEIHEGLLATDNAMHKALCYVRKLEGIEDSTQQPKADKFIDLTSTRAVDLSAKLLLDNLKTSKIPSKLQDGIKRDYVTPWTGKPLEESTDEEHRDYLNKFSTQFVVDMKRLIKEHVQSASQLVQTDIKLYHEVLHHAKFAREKTKLFCGRTNMLLRIKQSLLRQVDVNQPLVIHGKSGYGKTSLLAKVATNIGSWLDCNTITILRFLGTSPDSSDIIMVLKSVIAQLCAVFGHAVPNDGELQKMGDVRRHLADIINTIGNEYASIKVVIILDSVDQLLETNGAHMMTWLPKMLPPNIYMVLSVLSDRYSCLENAQARINSETQFICLNKLSGNTGEEIITKYLTMHSRKVTDHQKQLVTEAFNKNRQPLFLKLVLDAARKWYSYTDVIGLHISESVEQAICVLFEDLEVRYGNLLVQRALGYMTCGRGGLTDIEMEDILSCDNDVLNEVYKYHDPPLEDTIRIPSLLWARLEYELNEYLTERQVDGKTVLTWFHRQFWEEAEARYVTHHKYELNMALAHLFGQDNGIRKTIILKQRNNKVLENADRKVTPQKLVSSNARKINSLLHHLYQAQDLQELEKQCLLNFDFLFAKLKAFDAKELLNDYTTIADNLATTVSKAVRLFQKFLEMTFAPLNFDPNLMAFYIEARLSPFTEMAIVKVVSQARKWLQFTNQPMLLPLSPMNLSPVDSPLKFTMFVGFDGVLTPDEKVVVCNWLEKYTDLARVQALHLETKDMLVSFPVKRNSPIVVTPDSKHFFHADDEHVGMYEISSGDESNKWLLDDKYDGFTVKAMDVSHCGRYLAVAAKVGKPKSASSDEKKWRSMTMVYLIDLLHPRLDIHCISYHAKRHPDKILFIDDKLAVIAREGINIFGIPGLNEISSCKTIKGIHSNLTKYDSTSNSLYLAVELKVGIQFAVYNLSNLETFVGSVVHTGALSNVIVQPFGLEVSSSFQRTILGSRATGECRKSNLWIWKGNTSDSIELGNGQWKSPSCVKVTEDWKFGMVGWSNGDLSITNLDTLCEVSTVQAHTHSLQFMKLVSEGSSMVTLAADHSLKVWDVKELVGKIESDNTREAEAIIKLDMNEQVLSMYACDNFVITTGHLNRDGPKFWKIENGEKLEEKTAAYHSKYNEVIKDMPIEHDERYHATLDIIDNMLVYCRKKSDAIACFVLSASAPMIHGAAFYGKCFFHLVIPWAIYQKSAEPFQLMLVKDESLLCVDLPTMNSVKCINMPNITKDRRVLFYKVALTTDMKYTVMCNAAPHRQGKSDKVKYMEWFDISTATFKGRVNLPEDVPRKLLEDSIYYLVLREDGKPELVKPSMLPNNCTIEYKCLLYSSHSILSADLALGVELDAGYTVSIWNTKSIERVVTLKGHIAEVTCGHFSTDKRFLATGSYDCTVRLWDITSGQQLCLFHVTGSIDNVMFTPGIKQLAIHYYSAPQRKRVNIMALKNIPLKDKGNND